MLVRDKVGEEMQKAIDEVADSDVEIEVLTNEQFFEAIIFKIKSEIDVLEKTKSVNSLAEVVELIEWIQVALGTTNLQDIIEERADKLGMYWKKYYIKEKVRK